MPTQSQWLLRVPEIAWEISQLQFPVVDRAVFEKVFGVRRRRAHQLMHQFGGYQIGRTFLIDRGSLLRELERIQSGEEFGREKMRKKRLSGELEAVRKLAAASKVTVRIKEDIFNATLPDLPDGVVLQPGMLTVSFRSPEDLLERLFVLAQVLSNEFDRLSSVFG